MLKDGFIPPYRIRLFEQLAARTEASYTIIHGDAPSGSGHAAPDAPLSFPNIRVPTLELPLLGRSIRYQPVLGRLLNGRFDAVVAGSELRVPANWIAFWTWKAIGRPALLWGQGVMKEELQSRSARRLAAAGERLKGLMARRADGYLVYTAKGRDGLVSSGLDSRRVFVARNTLDIEEEIALHEEAQSHDEVALRRRFGCAPESVVLLYSGRLYAEKRVDELVHAVRELNAAAPARPIEAVIVGDGPSREEVERAAIDRPDVKILGEIRDPAKLAELMRIASALVIPGKVGLAANHALAHGVPVITRAGDFHAPEIEYVANDFNGLIVEGAGTDFVEALGRFASEPGLAERLAAGALASRADLSLQTMVDAFHGGVLETIERCARDPLHSRPRRS